MIDGYINTAKLKEKMPEIKDKICYGCYVDVANSYVLVIPFPSNQVIVLSKWRSDKPRFFVQADSLLKEARKFGFEDIRFGSEADELIV